MVMNIQDLKQAMQVCLYVEREGVCLIQLSSYEDLYFGFCIQTSILDPLDHKNLDVDVPYFKDNVRYNYTSLIV